MEPFTIEDLEDDITQQPGSPKPATDVISPEPPKWRFVKEAKKSAGYSSAAAGKVVKGKSSNELGAKYHAPDVSLYKPAPDKPEVNEMVDPKAPSFKQFEKEDEEVGELQPTNLYTKTAYMKELDDVGKLNIEEGTGGDEEDLPDGSFGGLPQFDSSNETSTKSFREFDNKYDVGQKPDREKGVWFDGDVEDNYKSESWGVEAGSVGGVGRLKFGGTDASEETYDGSFMKVKKEGEELNTEMATPTAISRGASEHGASSSLKSDEENGPAVDGMSTAMKKRRRCLVMLLLLPLFILVLLLGILLGKERKEEDSAGTALAVVPIFAENSTEAPSMAPSAQSVLPGPSCPTDSKLISLEDLSSAVNAKEPSQYIWYVKDACTGNVISSCLPCSESSLVLGNREDNFQQGRSNGHLRNLQSVAFQNQCVPSDGTYVFVVEPAVSPNQCCGFDTTSYILNYGDKVVASSEDDNSASSTEKQVVFGEGTACPAALLSSSPTGTPSKEPTPQPTKQPSPRPTPRPTKQPSSGPTNGPTCSTEQDFNLCLAVDMSGSVCNSFSWGNGDCLGCSLIEGCRNIFLDQDTCCNDFQSIKTFSQLMIRALDEFPAEKDFSIVQFATDASIASFPQPANAALSTVNNLSYTGGITNHAAAIASCQQSLSLSQNPGRKNFMMLITDGEPTAPENTAEAAANFMAAQAKSNGMFIIPIFISPTYDAYALSFMRGLSSDDKVFDVTGFDGLLNLQEALVNQVSCS